VDSLNNQLKRIATGISKENSQTSSTTDANTASGDVCPICGGLGVVTKDVPVEHPDFGKAFPCVCQRETLVTRRLARLHKLSNLDAVADKTFDTFALDLPGLTDEQLSTLRASYDRALRYAEEPQGWLLFQGNYGSGKTHLAAAIANYRLALGEQVLFITVPDLLDYLRSTYGPASEVQYDELFEQVRSAPMLVLDDLGAESATSWAQEKLYQLINHRYLSQNCTVITTNCELTRLDPRIRSRLVDWHLAQSVNMRLPDFRRVDASREPGALSDLSLYGDMVFETFDLRADVLPPNERDNLHNAYELAFSYARKPQDWLLITGEHGCGKTHLAAAIANYRHALGEEVVFITMSDLLDYLRAAFNPSATVTLDRRFDEIRLAQLLVLDQLDTTSTSSWAREKLRQIADHRYLARLPTVFTTAQTLEEIGDPMLRSRLSDTRRCHVFAMLAPDYRGGAQRSNRSRRRA
jgi:DNA replication protein DnaC